MATAFCKRNSPVGEGFKPFELRIIRLVTEAYRGAWMTTDVQQGLLMSALLSGRDEEQKLDFLLDKVQVRMSPDDTAVLACTAAFAWAERDNDTVLALKATAAVTASAAGAHTDAAAHAAAAAAAATLKDALAKAFAANQDADRAQAADPFRFDGSALKGVLEAVQAVGVHSTRPVDLMVKRGLRLTPLIGNRVIRSIIKPGDGSAGSSLLLQRILRCAGGVDLCYVDPSDDLTAVSFAVAVSRPDMVGQLLDHCPPVVNVAGTRLGLTPAHCVSPFKQRMAYNKSRDGHDCGFVNCCVLMNNLLYLRGANPDAENRNGNTPFLCQQGKDNVARQMRDLREKFFHPLKQAFRVARVSATDPDPEKLRRNKEFTHPSKKAFCAARVTAADEDKRCLIKLIPEDLLTAFVYPHLVSRDPAFPCFPIKPPACFCSARAGSGRMLE